MNRADPPGRGRGPLGGGVLRCRKVHFQSPFDDVTVEVPEGTQHPGGRREVRRKVGHACGGVCACSTCHVWVRKGLESLSEQEDAEADRLDQAFDVRPYSRLGCQSLVGERGRRGGITEESLQALHRREPRPPAPPRGRGEVALETVAASSYKRPPPHRPGGGIGRHTRFRV